ncbi:MAG: methyltransferase domain-containing protein [Rhodospirillaceae bacterium]|nr:methyltransferase domain-containing protein [Rhodospirillaceae bacterium]
MAEQPDTIANTAQFEYWNATAGDKWTENQKVSDRLLSTLAERLFQHAAIQPGEMVMDIGCGTDATALFAARAVGPDGGVLGIDLSHAMLGLARTRAEAGGEAANLVLEIADAQSHAFAQGTFDLLQSRFGVMFFDDPTAAFANLLGALRPGGRLCFVCWGPLAKNPWFKIPRDAAVKFLGPPKAAPPHAPGPLAFSDTDYVDRILSAAGFAEIQINTEASELVPPSTVADAATGALSRGPAARMIGVHKPPPETVAAIRAEIERGLSPYYVTDNPRVPAYLHFVLARRPE